MNIHQKVQCPRRTVIHVMSLALYLGGGGGVGEPQGGRVRKPRP